MNDVSTFRLYLLRATYLLMLVGLAVDIWPLVVRHPDDVELMRGVVWSLLAGVSLMAAVGLRYPLRMLPLLLFELTWKSVWVLAFGLPLWLGGRPGAESADTLKACLMGVVLCPLVIPWRYVWDHYVAAPGDRWRARAADVARTPAEARA